MTRTTERALTVHLANVQFILQAEFVKVKQPTALPFSLFLGALTATFLILMLRLGRRCYMHSVMSASFFGMNMVFLNTNKSLVLYAMLTSYVGLNHLLSLACYRFILAILLRVSSTEIPFSCCRIIFVLSMLYCSPQSACIILSFSSRSAMRSLFYWRRSTA